MFRRPTALVLTAWLLASLPSASPAAAAGQEGPYDIVVAGGTVMDPETGLAEVRNVGIRGDTIAAVTTEPIAGTVDLDATGLIVAPGFIDMHAHGQTYRANVFQAHDGVTTALELEGGAADVAAFLEARRGRALVNYGASVAHSQLRAGAIPEYAELLEQIGAGTYGEDGELQELFALLARAGYESVDPDDYGTLRALLERNLEAGGLGIGVPHQYYPGATEDEILRVFEMASEWGLPIYTHVRDMTVAAFQEVIANAAATGAPLHIVHINSSALGNIGTVLDLIEGARAHGVDVSAEAYPYTAASTGIESAIFDDGWQEKLGISYDDIQLQDTGERLTEESFRVHRERGGTVIIHMMKPEWIEMWMKRPFVMIASDGMPYAPGAHPRSAGTFTRVLGRYARDQEMLPVMEAISRMSYQPARRLERFAPAMARKGRIQVGMDADITVFDPGTVIDTATFEDDLSESEGVRHVLVNGVPVVRDGETVENIFPGRAVLGRLYAGPEESPRPAARSTPGRDWSAAQREVIDAAARGPVGIEDDFEAWESGYHPDWSYWRLGSDSIRSRDDHMALVRDYVGDGNRVIGFEMEPVDVIVRGPVALLRYNAVETLRETNGSTRVARFSSAALYVRDGESWRALATNIFYAPPPPE